MMLKMICFLACFLSISSVEALEIPPLVVGGGAGIATVYQNSASGQVNVPITQLQVQSEPSYLSVEARVGASVNGGGERFLANGSLLTVQFDYFYSLMLKSGLALFDPANTVFFQGGWSKFRVRSTTSAVSVRSNLASFGYGVGLRRQLGEKFGISAEYMRYSADIRATTLNVDYAL